MAAAAAAARATTMSQGCQKVKMAWRPSEIPSSHSLNNLGSSGGTSFCHPPPVLQTVLSKKYYGCLVINPCDIVRFVPELQTLNLVNTSLGNLQYMVSNFCNPHSWRQVELYLAGDPRIYFTVGVHPQWNSLFLTSSGSSKVLICWLLLDVLLVRVT